MTLRLALCALLTCAALTVGLLACERSSDQETQQSASLAPKPNELPPLELRDDTKDLLLTWVDEKVAMGSAFPRS